MLFSLIQSSPNVSGRSPPAGSHMETEFQTTFSC